jgi:two-component system NtrC family sensor kinase
MSADETALLYYVSRRLNSDLDINRVLADILDLTVQHASAWNGSIIVFDRAGTVAHKILARAGMPPEKEQTVIAKVLAEGLAGWVVDHQQGSIVLDVGTDERWISFEDDELIGGSAVSVPLLHRAQTIGVLTLRHPDPRHFTQDHLALLTSIADQAAIAVQNARLFHSVQTEQAKMEAIINGAGDAILVANPQGQMLMMNAVARQAFGVAADAPIEGQAFTALISHPALLRLWQHRDDLAYPSVEQVPLKDGRLFHANLSNVSGVGYIAMLQDITYLQELSQVKNDFVSVVSHDLRSPLQLVHTYAHLIGESRPLSQVQRDYLDGINRGVRKMASLIDDLLDLGKVEAGVDMEREVCHVDRVIASVTGRFEPIAAERGLKLLTEIPEDLGPVRANVRRIDQVLSNLIDNALKYTRQGEISVGAKSDGKQITAYVTDSGIGLMPQEQKELFTKFYRARNELNKDQEGTGLGLAISRSIIEQYGGQIWVRSTWQQGSTFYFSLPVDKSQS